MDLKSVFSINLILLFIAAFAMVLLWKQHRGRYHGLLDWSLMFLFSGIGSILIGLRGSIPDFISIILGNALIFIGLSLILVGFERFFSLTSTRKRNALFIAVVTLFYMIFTYIKPDLHTREMIFTVFSLVIYAQVIWLLHRRLTLEMRRITLTLQLIFILLITANLYRVIAVQLFPALTQDYFNNSFHETIFLVFALVQWAFFTFSLLMMVSQRLLSEVVAEESKFNTIFEHAPYSMALTRMSDAVITDVNTNFEALSGYRLNEVIGSRAQELGLWADPKIRDQMQDILEKGQSVNSLELMFRRKNGELVPVLYSASIVKIANDDYMLSSLKNISDIVDLRGKLELMATHDELTGLPNRVLFTDRFAIASAQSARTRTKFAVAIFDLDDFKKVNDELGHPFGDLLLSAVAERVSHFIRLSDTVARFGGDEFMILLNNIQSQASAEETLTRILEIYRQPFDIKQYSLKANISIGAALYPDDADNETDLLRKADEALYRVKRSGKNGLQFYSSNG